MTINVKAYEAFLSLPDIESDITSQRFSITPTFWPSQVFLARTTSLDKIFFLSSESTESLQIEIYQALVTGTSNQQVFTPDILLDSISHAQGDPSPFQDLDLGNQDSSGGIWKKWLLGTPINLVEGSYYIIVFKTTSTSQSPQIYWTLNYRQSIFSIITASIDGGFNWANDNIVTHTAGNMQSGSICFGYIGKQVDSTTSLDSGSLTIGGLVSSRRGYPVFIYVENEDALSTTVSINFSQIPPSDATNGTSEETDQSMMKWYFFEEGTLPISGDFEPILFKTNAQPKLGLESDFVFFIQPDRISPLADVYLPEGDVNLYAEPIGIVPIYESSPKFIKGDGSATDENVNSDAAIDSTDRFSTDFWAHLRNKAERNADNRSYAASQNPSYFDFSTENPSKDIEIIKSIKLDNTGDLTGGENEAAVVRGFNKTIFYKDKYVLFSKKSISKVERNPAFSTPAFSPPIGQLTAYVADKNLAAWGRKKISFLDSSPSTLGLTGGQEGTYIVGVNDVIVTSIAGVETLFFLFQTISSFTGASFNSTPSFFDIGYYQGDLSEDVLEIQLITHQSGDIVPNATISSVDFTFGCFLLNPSISASFSQNDNQDFDDGSVSRFIIPNNSDSLYFTASGGFWNSTMGLGIWKIGFNDVLSNEYEAEILKLNNNSVSYTGISSPLTDNKISYVLYDGNTTYLGVEGVMTFAADSAILESASFASVYRTDDFVTFEQILGGFVDFTDSNSKLPDWISGFNSKEDFVVNGSIYPETEVINNNVKFMCKVGNILHVWVCPSFFSEKNTPMHIAINTKTKDIKVLRKFPIEDIGDSNYSSPPTISDLEIFNHSKNLRWIEGGTVNGNNIYIYGAEYLESAREPVSTSDPIANRSIHGKPTIYKTRWIGYDDRIINQAYYKYNDKTYFDGNGVYSTPEFNGTGIDNFSVGGSYSSEGDYSEKYIVKITDAGLNPAFTAGSSNFGTGTAGNDLTANLIGSPDIQINNIIVEIDALGINNDSDWIASIFSGTGNNDITLFSYHATNLFDYVISITNQGLKLLEGGKTTGLTASVVGVLPDSQKELIVGVVFGGMQVLSFNTDPSFITIAGQPNEQHDYKITIDSLASNLNFTGIGINDLYEENINLSLTDIGYIYNIEIDGHAYDTIFTSAITPSLSGDDAEIFGDSVNGYSYRVSIDESAMIPRFTGSGTDDLEITYEINFNGEGTNDLHVGSSSEYVFDIIIKVTDSVSTPNKFQYSVNGGLTFNGSDLSMSSAFYTEIDSNRTYVIWDDANSGHVVGDQWAFQSGATGSAKYRVEIDSKGLDIKHFGGGLDDLSLISSEATDFNYEFSIEIDGLGTPADDNLRVTNKTFSDNINNLNYCKEMGNLPNTLPAKSFRAEIDGTSMNAKFTPLIYGIDGDIGKLFIYDYSDVRNIKKLSELSGFGSPNYMQVSGKYAYVLDQTGSDILQKTIFICDISDSYNPIIVSNFKVDQQPMFFDIIGPYMYVSCDQPSGKTKIFDISNYNNVLEIGNISNNSSGSIPYILESEYIAYNSTKYSKISKFNSLSSDKKYILAITNDDFIKITIFDSTDLNNIKFNGYITDINGLRTHPKDFSIEIRGDKVYLFVLSQDYVQIFDISEIPDSDSIIAFGYGYGFGQGADYFDVFAFEGSQFGYGDGDFESSYAFDYGYGFGYEYGYTSGLSLPENSTVKLIEEIPLDAESILSINGRIYCNDNENMYVFDSQDIENCQLIGFDKGFSTIFVANKNIRAIENISSVQDIHAELSITRKLNSPITVNSVETGSTRTWPLGLLVSLSNGVDNNPKPLSGKYVVKTISGGFDDDLDRGTYRYSIDGGITFNGTSDADAIQMSTAPTELGSTGVFVYWDSPFGFVELSDTTPAETWNFDIGPSGLFEYRIEIDGIWQNSVEFSGDGLNDLALFGKPKSKDAYRVWINRESDAYGYGYGYGQGADYFDVFGVPLSNYGYGYDSFEENNSENYGYGFGYEYGLNYGYAQNLEYVENDTFSWAKNGVVQETDVAITKNLQELGDNSGVFVKFVSDGEKIIKNLYNFYKEHKLATLDRRNNKLETLNVSNFIDISLVDVDSLEYIENSEYYAIIDAQISNNKLYGLDNFLRRIHVYDISNTNNPKYLRNYLLGFSVTSASNTTPILITTTSPHSFVNGNYITLEEVIGNENANGNFYAKVADFTITNATNTSPIVITTATAHGFSNGDMVRISGIYGNSAANGLFFINNKTMFGFELYYDSSFSTPVVGNGAYTSGGKLNSTTNMNFELYSDSSLSIPVSGSGTGSGGVCIYQTLNIINVTGTSPMEVTTSINHGMKNGDLVELFGIIESNAANNGSFFINVTGNTTFELYSDPALASPADGTSNGTYISGGIALLSGNLETPLFLINFRVNDDIIYYNHAKINCIRTIDVSDPENPLYNHEVSFLNTEVLCEGMEICNNNLYMNVFDTTSIRLLAFDISTKIPVLVGSLAGSTGDGFDLMTKDEENPNFLYMYTIGDGISPQYNIYNVSDPTNPTNVGIVSPWTGTINSIAITFCNNVLYSLERILKDDPSFEKNVISIFDNANTLTPNKIGEVIIEDNLVSETYTKIPFFPKIIAVKEDGILYAQYGPVIYTISIEDPSTARIIGKVSESETFNITNATNTNPIIITTSEINNFAVGDVITAVNVKGNTTANGLFIVFSLIDDYSFEIYKAQSGDPAVGSADYISGGVLEIVRDFRTMTYNSKLQQGHTAGDVWEFDSADTFRWTDDAENETIIWNEENVFINYDGESAFYHNIGNLLSLVFDNYSGGYSLGDTWIFTTEDSIKWTLNNSGTLINDPVITLDSTNVRVPINATYNETPLRISIIELSGTNPLVDGQLISIYGVTDQPEANGIWYINVVSKTHIYLYESYDSDSNIFSNPVVGASSSTGQGIVSFWAKENISIPRGGGSIDLESSNLNTNVFLKFNSSQSHSAFGDNKDYIEWHYLTNGDAVPDTFRYTISKATGYGAFSELLYTFSHVPITGSEQDLLLNVTILFDNIMGHSNGETWRFTTLDTMRWTDYIPTEIANIVWNETFIDLNGASDGNALIIYPLSNNVDIKFDSGIGHNVNDYWQFSTTDTISVEVSADSVTYTTIASKELLPFGGGIVNIGLNSADTENNVYIDFDHSNGHYIGDSWTFSTSDTIKYYTMDFGYGYGYGQGADYFDVFGLDGIGAGVGYGYGYDSFESSYAFDYGYGFGYEYGDLGVYHGSFGNSINLRTGVPIRNVDNPMVLNSWQNNQVGLGFINLTGHTIGDFWTFQSADTYSYEIDGISQASLIEANGDFKYIENDVYLKFADIRGHSIGDSWTFKTLSLFSVGELIDSELFILNENIPLDLNIHEVSYGIGIQFNSIPTNTDDIWIFKILDEFSYDAIEVGGDGSKDGHEINRVITGIEQILGNSGNHGDISLQFGNQTGHNLGDSWTFQTIDTFKWKKGSDISYTSGQKITQTPIALTSANTNVSFSNQTNHKIGDKWIFDLLSEFVWSKNDGVDFSSSTVIGSSKLISFTPVGAGGNEAELTMKFDNLSGNHLNDFWTFVPVPRVGYALISGKGVYNGKTIAKYTHDEYSSMITDYPALSPDLSTLSTSPRVGIYCGAIVGAVSETDNIRSEINNIKPELISSNGISYIIINNFINGIRAFKTYGIKELPENWGKSLKGGSNTLVDFTSANLDNPNNNLCLGSSNTFSNVIRSMSVCKANNVVLINEMKVDDYSGFNNIDISYPNRSILAIVNGLSKPQYMSMFYQLNYTGNNKTIDLGYLSDIDTSDTLLTIKGAQTLEKLFTEPSFKLAIPLAQIVNDEDSNKSLIRSVFSTDSDSNFYRIESSNLLSKTGPIEKVDLRIKALKLGDISLSGPDEDTANKKVVITGIVDEGSGVPENAISNGVIIPPDGEIIVDFAQPIYISEIAFNVEYFGYDASGANQSKFEFYVLSKFQKEKFGKNIVDESDWVPLGSSVQVDLVSNRGSVAKDAIGSYIKAFKIVLRSNISLKISKLAVKSFVGTTNEFVTSGNISSPEMLIVDDALGLLNQDIGTEASFTTMNGSGSFIELDLGDNIPATRIAMNTYSAGNPTRTLTVEIWDGLSLDDFSNPEFENIYSNTIKDYEYSIINWTPRLKDKSREVKVNFIDSSDLDGEFGISEELKRYNKSANSTLLANSGLTNFSFRPNIFKDASLTITSSKNTDGDYQGSIFLNCQMDEDGPFASDLGSNIFGTIEKNLNIDFAMRQIRKIKITLGNQSGNDNNVKINGLKLFSPIVDENGVAEFPRSGVIWTIRLTASILSQ